MNIKKAVKKAASWLPKKDSARTGKIHHVRDLILILAAAAAATISIVVLNATPLSVDVGDRLKKRISAASGKSLVHFSYNDEGTARLLKTFYQKRNGLPAWSHDEGPTEEAAILLQLLKRAYREGLYPQDYQADRIEDLMMALNKEKEEGRHLNPDQLVDLDLLLTEAFFSYAAHFSAGRADHQRQSPDLVYKPWKTDLITALVNALEKRDVERTLCNLAPRFYGYQKLRERLNDYIDIAEQGGWPMIPPGRDLGSGMRDNRVSLLRNRLRMTSGVTVTPERGRDDYFDPDLEVAVRQFQQQHGLREDGIVRQTVLQELNVPVEVRICQIAVNLDRLRWLPRELENRLLLINVPAFNLEVVEDNSVLMNIRAIVGAADKRTNLLSRRITSLELNPYWRVPKSIAETEYLPELKKNPRYLAGKNMKVFTGDYETGPISPDKIDWSLVPDTDFPYYLRQEPGADNPLGRFKFVFPSECYIYIHDTPTRHLFSQSQRSFSHGCIRIEKPLDLAAYLLKGDENDPWSREKIRAEIRKGKNKVLTLSEPIPVHIVYETVRADREGNLHFLPDIYDIDNIRGHLPVLRASLERRITISRLPR